jgi:hypothetical protein
MGDGGQGFSRRAQFRLGAPVVKGTSMTDQEAALALAGRLEGQHGACPICETDSWRVEMTSSPTGSLNAYLDRALRNHAKEGEMTRTCLSCGYRQHFAAAPIASSSTA